MIQSNTGIKWTAGTVPLEREVLVIGGGVSGMTAALALAGAGVHVTIIEKGDSLGGEAGRLRIFYDRPGGVDKWLAEMVARLGGFSNIDVIKQARLHSLKGHFGSFRARIGKKDGTFVELSPAAIVVAAGAATTGEIRGMPVEGAGVIHISAMEKLIAETADRDISWNGRRVESVVFILDMVNADIKIDSIDVLKQAHILRHKYECSVSVLCRDLKVAFSGGERLYRKAREEGVLFFKYDADPGFFIEEGRICANLPDDSDLSRGERRDITLRADLFVTPEACAPGAETDDLCRILRISRGPRGFIMDDNPQLLRIRSNRRGIFVTGSCRYPQDLAETQREAEATAQEITVLLSPGEYACGPRVAEVDAGKCALCYTCPRLCPHSAITIEKYGRQSIYRTVADGDETVWNAARVEPAACYGCGICVAECPARAIALRGEGVYFEPSQQPGGIYR